MNSYDEKFLKAMKIERDLAPEKKRACESRIGWTDGDEDGLSERQIQCEVIDGDVILSQEDFSALLTANHALGSRARRAARREKSRSFVEVCCYLLLGGLCAWGTRLLVGVIGS